MKRFTLESIKPFSVLFISLILCAGKAWGAGTAISDLNFSNPSSLPSGYTYSSTNPPTQQSNDDMSDEDAGNRNCVNLNSGGGSTAPTTFSADNSSAPTGGQRWLAFQPAEDCTVTITVGMVNNGRVFYLLNKDHKTTSDCVSSYTPGARYRWYDDWTVNLTGGTWYTIMGSGSNCLIHAMAFSTSCSATQPGLISKDIK